MSSVNFETKDIILSAFVIGMAYLMLAGDGSESFENPTEKLKKCPRYDDKDTFPDTLTYNNVPCNLSYSGTSKRYMYQAIPPRANSSYDIRNAPAFIPPADMTDFGIFQHTDIYGNYRDERICPNFP